MASNRRRGSAYILVLSVAMLITTIGLSALSLARVERLSGDDAGDMAAARGYARAAIELGLFEINDNPDWRSTVSNRPWIDAEAIGAGTMSLHVAFVPDGDAEPYNDAVELTGTGTCGSATQRLRVRVENGAVVAESGWSPIMASGGIASD